MPSADEIRRRIETGIPGAAVEVQTADEVHFTARIVASAFGGLNRIQQHRLVYDIFEPGEIGGPIHALSIKTETP